MNYYDLINSLAGGAVPTPEEAEALILCEDEGINQYLFTQADLLRSNLCGQIVYIFGVILFSNICSGRCSFCGMNADNTHVKRFRMEPDEVVDCAVKAANAGYKEIVLQSGNDDYFTHDILGDIIKRIKETVSVDLTLSVGERSYDDYNYWKQCGADHIFMSHSTSDVWLYNTLGKQTKLSNRLICQRMAKSIGYKVDGGFLVGIPAQKPGSIWDDIRMLKDLEANVVNIEAFPEENTEFQKGRNVLAVKKTVAVARLYLRDTVLVSPNSIDIKKGNLGALDCGANALCQYIDTEKYYSFIKKQLNLKSEYISPEEKRRQIVSDLSVMKRFAY